nr:YiaA/YiaB family inner membrane protein [Fluviispira vulneris]
MSELIAILLLSAGLWNSSLTLSEKGFYGMSFKLSLFAAIAVQKNTRDLKQETKPKKVVKEGSGNDFFKAKDS